jgi:hypothetical protein
MVIAVAAWYPQPEELGFVKRPSIYHEWDKTYPKL